MLVYLDNAATTRVRQEVAEAMLSVLTRDFGNPSSTHQVGRQARHLLDGARAHVAASIGAKSEEIFFTSGGTEADNWALREGAALMRHQGKHILVSAVEHDAVRRTAEHLVQQGFSVTWLAPDDAGRITPEAVAAALQSDTVLVSVMLVNNETGAVNDVAGIRHVLRAAGSPALLHTDAVQALGKIPFSVSALGADLLTVSAHKIHGPKGVGALYIRKELRLPGLILGGSQENGRRGGTEALPAIVGFGEAARLATAEAGENQTHLRVLRQTAVEQLGTIPGITFIGQGDAPHILSLSLPGYRSEVLLNYLDAAGICVSKSSACKKGARSHVLEAMKLPAKVIDGAIRVSFSRENTAEDAVYLAESLAAAAKTLFPSLH